MSRRPLLWLAAAFAAGIAAPAAATPASCSFSAIVLFAGALALLRLATCRAAERLAIVFLLLGFSAAGTLASAVARTPAPLAIDRLVGQHEERFAEGVELEGTLVRALRARSDPLRHELRFRVDAVRVGSIRLPATGQILLVAPSDAAPPGLGRGDRVTLFATLRLPRETRSPGAFDHRRHLLARGIRATGRLKSWALLTTVAPHHRPMTRFLRGLDRARGRTLAAIAAAFPDSPEGRRAAGVCMAMLVGERVLPDEDEEALAMAGLNHLLAVSGFNVAILAATTFFVLRCLGSGMRWAWIGTIPALLVYLLLNSEESSVLRAVVMGGTFLLGRACWMRVDMLNALGGAAVGLLAASPLQIHEPGFQLTFVATLALLLAGPLGATSVRGEGSGALRRWLIPIALGTLTATLATLPLVAHHFHRVAPAALPANLVAGPLMAAAFVASLLMTIVATVSGALAGALAQGIVAPLIAAVFRVAAGIVALPGMSWRVPPPHAVCALAYFATMAAAVSLRRSERFRPLWGAAALAWLAAGLAIAVPRDTRARPDGLGITMLDVGQGDSILIETSLGERMLVDAGGAPGSTFDVGERVVSPALWRMGLTRLETVVVTHADHDHAAGMAAILRNFRPSELWLAQRDGRSRMMSNLALQAGRTGTRVRIVRAGDAYCRRGARISILSAGDPGGAGRNEGSIVMKVSSAGRHVLLMGDAGRDTESRLLAVNVAADVLKVGHHGSRTATTASFLAAVAPSLAMISCGRGNRFGHPHPEVLERLERREVLVCRTDQDGAPGVVLAPGATLLSGPCRDAPRRRRSASQSEGMGDEAERQHAEPGDGHQAAAEAQRKPLVQHRRVVRRDKNEQCRENQPARKDEEPHAGQGDQGEDRDHAMKPRRDRVDHMPAIELSDRQEVQSRREAADVAGHERARQDPAVTGGHLGEQEADETPEERHVDARHVLGNNIRGRGGHEAIGEHGKRHDEPRDGPGDPDVEERVAILKPAPDADERAECPHGSDGERRSREEVGEGGIHAIDSAGHVMTHLVRAQNREQGQSVGKTEPQEGWIDQVRVEEAIAGRTRGRDPRTVQGHGVRGQPQQHDVTQQPRARRRVHGRAGERVAGGSDVVRLLCRGCSAVTHGHSIAGGRA